VSIYKKFLLIYNWIFSKKDKKVSMDKYLIPDPLNPSSKLVSKSLSQPAPSNPLARAPLQKLDNLKKRIQVPLPEESH